MNSFVYKGQINHVINESGIIISILSVCLNYDNNRGEKETGTFVLHKFTKFWYKLLKIFHFDLFLNLLTFHIAIFSFVLCDIVIVCRHTFILSHSNIETFESNIFFTLTCFICKICCIYSRFIQSNHLYYDGPNHSHAGKEFYHLSIFPLFAFYFEIRAYQSSKTGLKAVTCLSPKAGQPCPLNGRFAILPE